MIKLSEDLRRWFKEKWTAQDGSECGDYKGRGRVKCRPSRRVSEKSPQTWGEMTPEEKKKAVRKKQEAHRKGKQWSSHKTGKTWDGPKNKYRPKKKKMNESLITEDDMAQDRGESIQDYHARLLRQIQNNNISAMDHHDRLHGAIAFLEDLKKQNAYPGKSIPPLILRVKDTSSRIPHARGIRVTGIGGKSHKAIVTGIPASAGGHRSYHGDKPEEQDVRQVTGIMTSNYAFMRPEHINTLQRLIDFRGIREMIEPLKQLLAEAKEKKPYKGFKKGKNHPEGGLSRAEARRQGIHAGIETKDEAKRKGGFGKLSKKTQKRRKSFCARMCGMKRRRTSSKTANDPKSKINAALRVWGCRCGTNESYENNDSILNEQLLLEKNKPTNTKLWARAKALARQKFDVYPSAYANGWAAKWYKKKGGEWVSENLNHIQQKVKDKFLTEGCGCGGGKSKPQPKPQPKTTPIPTPRPKQYIPEEVVNQSNKDTMSDKEIKSRDKTAKKLTGVRVVKKGDTLKNAKYRLATYIELLKRKGKKTNKKVKG
jgi:hypothetical protein